MNKDEAYLECKSRMETAAFNIRAAALSHEYESDQPPKGNWPREHIYWLFCMDYVESQPANTLFKIDNDNIYVKGDCGFMLVKDEGNRKSRSSCDWYW